LEKFRTDGRLSGSLPDRGSGGTASRHESSVLPVYDRNYGLIDSREFCPSSFCQDHDALSPVSYCTLILTVAVLLLRTGSSVSAKVAASSVIKVTDEAVTFTVSRTVHVVFGAILAFS
jgi:hypothetical protein